jgi:hypothetical protein
MKVSKRAAPSDASKIQKSETKKPAKATKAAQPRAEKFETGAKTDHARRLDGDNATKARIPQSNLYGATEDRADRLRARMDEGVLKRVSAPNVGSQKGIDLGPGEFDVGLLTERRAFEVGGKTYVHATILYEPGKTWFEVGDRPPPPPPDPAIAMREKVDARKLVPLAGQPAGVKGNGLSIGPGGYHQGELITERRAYEANGRLFIRATVLYEPAQQWFEAKA